MNAILGVGQKTPCMGSRGSALLGRAYADILAPDEISAAALRHSPHSAQRQDGDTVLHSDPDRRGPDGRGPGTALAKTPSQQPGAQQRMQRAPGVVAGRLRPLTGGARPARRQRQRRSSRG